MRGERLQEARIEPDGISGDRLLRVEVDERLVTARTRRELLSLPASIGASGVPLIAAEPWDGEAARLRLQGVLPGASLVTTATGSRFDELPVLVVGAATVAELGIDHRRLRPSVLVEGLASREEESWVGSKVEIGAATLSVSHRCERCVVTTIDPDDLVVDPSVLERINSDFEGRIGVVCTVVVPGTVRPGDEVRALTPE